jgi:hypothetical protein
MLGIDFPIFAFTQGDPSVRPLVTYFIGQVVGQMNVATRSSVAWWNSTSPGWSA